MIPGEYRIKDGTIEINKNRPSLSIIVVNMGDRPIQVGSHYHFYEVNRALKFDRTATIGMRLNIIAGTAVRFEPGEQKPVELVPFSGHKVLIGFNNLVNGPVDIAHDEDIATALKRWEEL